MMVHPAKDHGPYEFPHTARLRKRVAANEALEDRPRRLEALLPQRKAAAEPEILALSCGENVGAGPSHFDLAVVMDFADIDAFRRYIGGAVHRAYVEGPAKAAVGRLA